MSERMKELVSILNKANEYYYKGKPFIDNALYDKYYDELVCLEKETDIVLSNSPTINIEYGTVDEINKSELPTPMLSLDKCHSVEEIISFISDKHMSMLVKRAFMSVKLDGNSICAVYENGKLKHLYSRGNGVIGNILDVHIPSFKNLPLEIPYKGYYETHGEAIITLDDFDEINISLSDDKKFANSRNTVAGSLSLLDSNISKERRLKFFAWDVKEGDYSNSYFKRLMCASDYGFDVVPIYPYPINKNNVNDALNWIVETCKKLHIPYDGAVIRFDDIKYGESLGRTDKYFRNGIAYKYEDQVAETTIKNIEWSMGKNKLTPVAIFDPPVELEGTTVERASLHNVSIIKELEIGLGDTVTVFKANAIIPQIRDNLTRSNTYKLPRNCPICNGKLSVVKENLSEELICTNPYCPAKLVKRLCQAVSRDALNIDGLSEETIQKFVKLKYISSISDIYHLDEYYSQLCNLDGFGKKSIDKLLDNIEKSKETTLERFIYALSIDLVGRRASKEISKRVYEIRNKNKPNMSIIEAFWKLIDKKYDWSKIDGFGDKINNSIYSFMDQNYEDVFFGLSMIFNFKEENNTVKKSSISNRTFVVTGSVNHFSNRKELQKKIEELGGKIASSVTSKTDYLINNDNTSNSSKNKKAKELNIPIITEEEFLEMIKE